MVDALLSQPLFPIICRDWLVHRRLHFYHKSFYDFLRNHITLVSSASSLLPFLKTVRSLDSKSPTLCIKLCYWWFKHVFPPLHLPATIALSWPYGTEFVDSFLKSATFSALSFICADSLCTFLRMFRSLYNASSVAGISVTVWTSYTLSECIGIENFDELVLAEFLLACFKYNCPKRCQAVGKYKKAKVIRPHVPLFSSSRVSAFLHFLSRKRSRRRNSGVGMGESRLYGVGNLMWRSGISISL